MQKCIQLTGTNARRLDHINLRLQGSRATRVLIVASTSLYTCRNKWKVVRPAADLADADRRPL